ncbi:uncharacterized protein J4E88_005503 [Alternaria novae-zelandiae]|uniref:uncharacterized protein n=1 Tax=Alternaria novae-zelandiae TaxID=430562 RepID=UPI0020C1C131|nr:uncharacterized protein J4E88_005503 [Alternaria novae-zelandiae]KAI4680998.1 hypothetical protein J4E88_005503 [Alternaria novae-zelandiae]
MSNHTPEDPATSALPTYTILRDTALNFIRAQTLDTNSPERMDFDLMRTYCAPSFEHSWGHNYAVSLTPPIQGTHSLDGFFSHLRSMLPRLESWKSNVTDVIVDPVKMKVILRISFMMQAKGATEGQIVENDLLWMMEMEEMGDGKVGIKKSMEFLDGAAAGKLREIMMAIA